MPVSVTWLLAQEHLSLAHRAGPRTGGQEIRFVQPTELQDPSPWLSGGELVLTTGLDFPSEPAQSQSYIERLHLAGVAALAFGTGLSHPAVPAAVLEAGDRYGLAVLEVPLSTPFAAVTKAVMARLAEQDYEHVLQAAKVQTRITRSALRGGAAAIVRELAVATGTAVALVDARSAIVHPPSRTDVPRRAREALAAGTGSSASGASITINIPGRHLTVQPVGSATGSHRHLVVSSTDSLSNIERVLLGHAVSLLTLELEKSARLRTQQSRLNTTALTLVLGDVATAGSMASVLDAAGDENGRIRALVIRTPAAVDVHDLTDRAWARAERDVYACRTAEATVILLRGTEEVATVLELVDELPSVAKTAFRAGLSTPHPIDEVRAAVDEATLACTLATPQAPVHQFRAVGEDTVLASRAATDVLLTIGANIVPALSNYSGVHSGTLTASLRTYLEMNGQWEPAASRLGIHRHTLRSRIARIEELLDCDLSQARVRAEILLALIAWDSRRDGADLAKEQIQFGTDSAQSGGVE